MKSLSLRVGTSCLSGRRNVLLKSFSKKVKAGHLPSSCHVRVVVIGVPTFK